MVVLREKVVRKGWEEDEDEYQADEPLTGYYSDDEEMGDGDGGDEARDVAGAEEEEKEEGEGEEEEEEEEQEEEGEEPEFVRGNIGDMSTWFLETASWIRPPNQNDTIDKPQPMYEPGTDTAIDFHSTGSKLLRKRLGFAEDVEHLAGPGCQSSHGYNGHEISEEEMRMCQTSQCLVRKLRGMAFKSENDDEDYEQTGDFFLSGLNDGMPSRDCDNPDVTPARHGRGEPYAENCMWDEDQTTEYAMPFHPYCFEVYKRTSLLLSGKVNVPALTTWWSLEASYDLFHSFPRHEDVDENTDQWWEHKNGTAYLAADPLHVPKLEEIFRAVVETDENFDPRSGAFSVKESQQSTSITDPFALLPGEIQFEILDCLASKDIAALRLSSRSVSQLPISYFQKLILREMPWLWEAWPTNANSTQMKYSKWATRTALDLQKHVVQYAKEKEILTPDVQIMEYEIHEANEILTTSSKHYKAIMATFQAGCEKSGMMTPFFLPPRQTNYFKLYTLITRHWAELRGLQNRKRIWTDCEEIWKRVLNYREEGMIDQDWKPTEPVA